MAVPYHFSAGAVNGRVACLTAGLDGFRRPCYNCSVKTLTAGAQRRKRHMEIYRSDVDCAQCRLLQDRRLTLKVTDCRKGMVEMRVDERNDAGLTLTVEMDGSDLKRLRLAIDKVLNLFE